MALTVAISGNLNINQGGMTTLTAAVTDDSGNAPPGALVYHWTTTRGAFVGATDQASAVYHADFTDSSDVDVMVTCSVARSADASPTISDASLDSMRLLGIENVILNMYISDTDGGANGNNTVIYAEGDADATLETGSDDDISDSIHIWRVQWHEGNDWFILNNNGTGSLSGFFSSNTAQSIYLVFANGTYEELTNSSYDAGGDPWARWNVDSATIRGLLDGLDDDGELVVAVADAGSIGLDADTGSGTATVRAAASMTPPPPPMGLPVISAVDPQTVIVDMDYELDVGITNIDVDDGDTVQVDGLLEGFYYDWNGDTNQVEIRGRTERLIDEAIWTVTAENDVGMATGRITWRSIPPAPIIEEIGAQEIYRGAQTNLFLEVQNNPVIVNAEGLLTGLRYQPETRVIGGEPLDGLVIEGIIPYDADQTVDDATFAIYAENLGGMDSYDLPVDIEDADAAVYVFCDIAGFDDVYKISVSGTLLWSYTTLPAGTYHPLLAYLDGSLYAFNTSTRDLYKLSASGELEWTYSGLPSSGNYSNFIWMAIDGSRVFVLHSTSGDLYCISSAGDLLWSLDLPATSFDIILWVHSDSSIYLLDETGNDVYRISSDGEVLWEFDSLTDRPSDNLEMVLHSDGSVYLFNTNDFDLYKVSALGALLWENNDLPLALNGYLPMVIGEDGSAYLFAGLTVDDLFKISPSGELEWQYQMPVSGTNRNFSSMAVHSDGSVYVIVELEDPSELADDQNAALYKVSADGELLWTFTGLAPGLGVEGVGRYKQIVLDTDGNVYLLYDVTGSNDRAYKVMSNGTLGWEYTGLPDAGYAPLLLDQEGNVYILNLTNEDVYKISPSGSLEWTYAGIPAGSGPEFVRDFRRGGQ